MKDHLAKFSYTTEVINVSSEILTCFEKNTPQFTSEYDRIKHFMDLGNRIRKEHEDAKIIMTGVASRILSGRENVYDFSLGNPNVPAPKAVKEAIIELLNEEDPVKLHGYTNSNAGYPEVRAAVADSLNERFGTAFEEKNIVMTVGVPRSPRFVVGSCV